MESGPGFGDSFADMARTIDEHAIPAVQAAVISAADLQPVSAPGLTMGRDAEPDDECEGAP